MVYLDYPTGNLKRKANVQLLYNNSKVQKQCTDLKTAKKLFGGNAAYTKADLDWMNKKSRSSVEMSDKKYRPEIMEKEIDMSSYDEIFLGFPIWWYVAPTIINTFLETYDFSGKKIVLFATSGGSGFGNTVKELQISAPDAVITEGSLLNRGTKQEISEWVKSL